MFNIPKSFWKDMEKPGAFKYVIYGDSVTENGLIFCKFKNDVYNFNFLELWDFLLRNNFNIIDLNFKEYIYFENDDFKILTYNSKLEYATPLYLMRHWVMNQTVYELNNQLTVTEHHSLINLDNGELIQILPEDAVNLLTFDEQDNIEEVNIFSKNKTKYFGYVYDFEVKETHNFVVNNILVHNTDSMYINLPNIKPKTTEEAIDVSERISKEINDLITEYTNDFILKKLNVPKQFNRTDYKTELVASAMMLLDVKKYYAYKIIAEKGKVFKVPKIEYKGIPVVRVDYSKFTQDLIRALVEEIGLNTDPNLNTDESLRKLFLDKYELLKTSIKELNITYIGVPGKWKIDTDYKKEPFQITAMRLYNSITKTESFKEGTSGYSIPIVLNAPAQLIAYLNKLERNKYYLPADIGLDKITYISFPYNFDKLKIMKLLNEFNLSIEFDHLWENLYSTSAHRICETIKNSQYF